MRFRCHSNSAAVETLCLASGHRPKCGLIDLGSFNRKQGWFEEKLQKIHQDKANTKNARERKDGIQGLAMVCVLWKSILNSTIELESWPKEPSCHTGLGEYLYPNRIPTYTVPPIWIVYIYIIYI